MDVGSPQISRNPHCAILDWVVDIAKKLPANFQSNTNSERNEGGKHVEDEDREITTEQKEIVHFSSEGVIPSTSAVPDIFDLDTSYLSMTTREERQHTIVDFLKRPIIITTGLWSSATAAETQLYTANFPESLIANAMYQDKLKGFVGLRATLVIKVQVNSQPFQQGRLMLQYYPYAQYMPNRVALVNATLQGRSGCPRVDLDLSVGTEVEMRIPYVSPHVYYNLITGQGSFGAIYLVVYSQLRDQISGTGSVEYTVWAHLEDVDIQYPTGANIFTGSGPNYAILADKLRTGKLTQADVYDIYAKKTYSKPPDKIFAQMANETQEYKQQGTIFSGIGQVADGISTIMRRPLLGNLFTKPGWISTAFADISKILGFSKPTTQALPCESKLRGQNRMTNFDGADTSHKMALSAANEIETHPGMAGTSADEMELGHVLSIPNYWDRFTWSTTDATGVDLWDNYVTPVKIKPYSATITDRYRCTHMGYVANAMTYWRGSIVYTFKFVKTQFHSGRLRISFIPYYFNSTISTGAPDVSRTQKVIVDLRTSTEVSFTVPYVSSRPWMYCIRPEASWLGTNNALMYNAVSGIVRVEVLNQLVAANNVFQSIDTIVEVSGGPDLTFAGPTCPSYVPYSGAFTMAALQEEKAEAEEEYGDKYPNSVPNVVRAQMMGENESVPRNEAQKGMHPMSIDTHEIKANWSPEANCIGEKIMSIRQLIKRFGSFYQVAPSFTSPEVLVAPFSVPTPTTAVGGTKTISNFEYYYFLYAFWRGGMRVKSSTTAVYPQSTGGALGGTFYLPWVEKVRASVRIELFTSVQDTFNYLVGLFTPGTVPVQIGNVSPNIQGNGNSIAVVEENVEGMSEVEVPFYNVSHICPATTYDPSDRPVIISNVMKGHIPPAILVYSTPNFSLPGGGTQQQLNLSYFRAAADDMSFMYLVGVPPLVNTARP